jgi:hypothetical protein
VQRLPVEELREVETEPHELALLPKAGSEGDSHRGQGNGKAALLVADAT